MLSFRPLFPPFELVLITTTRCNLACRECCFGCRPENRAAMDFEQMKNYIDTCLEAYPDSLRILSITGGECMLIEEDVMRAIEYASSKGIKTNMITNGFWAKSYKKAYETIKKLKSLGLYDIAVSTGDRNQIYDTFRGCRNVVVAAARLGIGAEIRLFVNFGKSDYLQLLNNDKILTKLIKQERIRYVILDWSKDFSNETTNGRLHPTRCRPWNNGKPCDSLFKSIILTPYGDVMACCGISCARIPYMRLGNINEDCGIRAIYNRAFADALKVWLHKKGPGAILRYIYDHTDLRIHHTHGTRCLQCQEIFENPKILPFLKQSYHDWRSEIQTL